MADITIKDVENTAKLANLEFSGEEKEKFAEQFSDIVKFVEKISELDTENVPPTTHAVEKKNVLRKDETRPSLPLEDLENNAPQSIDGSFIVPRVIEH